MDRRRVAGVLLALAACVGYATAAPTASNHTSLDLYDGAPDGCYYNFQHYGESDRIMTNEPCLNCTCHNRMLMCYLRVCPFTKPIGQDCTIEKRADQCCPIVTCPDVPVDLLTSTTTSPAEYGSTGLGKLDKYGCSIHGKYFPEGSKVPPTPNKPCEHCYCIRNMTTCVMQECTLHVDGCTPIYHKDVCCPVRYSCDHPEDEMPLLDDLSTTVRPTPGFLLTTTTLSPVTQMSQDCLYENQIIPDGALIKTEKACDHCYCMKGDIVCVVQECGTPMENEGKNCSALAPREGVCCPDTYICEGDEPTGTYDGLDYTTELEQEIHTTLLPPRRAGSEGSGYRNEPDDILKTELPSFETETEGSGDEQATIPSTVVTEQLPESHKMELADTISSSTEEPHEFITFTTSRAPVSEYEDAPTEINKHIDTSETQQYITSTTSTYISQQSDELSTTKPQDGDVGSGEEEIITPHEIVPTSSDSPTIDESEPVTIEQDVATESKKEDSYDSMTSTPTVVEDQTNLPKEQSVTFDGSAVDITTETHHHLDEDESVKSTTTIEESEQSSLRTTTSVPSIEEDEKITMASVEKDKMDVHHETDTTFNPQHYLTSSTSSPSFEDEFATTDSQSIVTDSFEGAEADFDPHHQIMITASTPLLEEIEKDTTDQESISDESTLDKHKTSTISTNIFKEETTDKDSLKPDLLDENIATNSLTTISPFDNDDLRTAEPQTSQETEVEESSEPQHYVPITSAPAFDDESKKTTPFDSSNISDLQKGQALEVEDSSEPQEYSSTTSATVLEDESKKTTFSDFKNTSEPQKVQESDVEDSSEPQHYAPTTIAYNFDDETKESDSFTTLEPQETDVEGSSEAQQLAPITSAPTSDKEIKQTVQSQSLTTSKPKKSQETNVEESSEPQQYTPTTSASAFIDESKKTTLLESITTLEPQKAQETDTKESSESQEYATTTSAPAFDNEGQKTTASESIITQEPQKGYETDFGESSESQFYSPTTNAPAFGDESKKTTSFESISSSESQKGQETDVEESSVPQLYYPTTNAPLLEGESKKTTQPDIQHITDAIFENNDVHEASSATPFEQNEITTAEPDKGLNTIPSGSIEDETTESPEVEKYTKVGEIITEKATEFENKFGDGIQSITDQYKFTTSIPQTSASQEDQLSLTSESIVNENVDSIGSTETHDIVEQTTVLFDISEEGMTHPSSTKSNESLYQGTGTTLVPLNTENIKQTADSMEPKATVTYESSTKATAPEDSTSTKHEIITLSYATVPESSTANLEENEIFNEPRIPGEGDCLLNGVTYRNESAVPSTNKCQSGCRCSSSIIKCNPILCSPPPEYMNNCQTTYDSPDSCCPTYVCDHKTETMPPQSHSQMSGTEAPLMSPVECNGNKCVLSQDKNQSVETPALCDFGSCITQDETSSHQSNIPVQPVVDQQEGCTGDKCTSFNSSDQLCSPDNGCHASVKPCEGTDCEIEPGTILPQKQQPCADSDNCDVPVKDCNAGKCSPDALSAEKKPNEKICVNKEDCEDQLNIETECSEKSCKRKDNFPSEQQPPKKCSGNECQSIDFISGLELTTSSSLAITQKEVEHEEQTQSTDNFESETEKPEKSSKLPSIDSDRITRPIKDVTEEPGQQETIQPSEISEKTTTNMLTDTTKLPDLDDKVKISTVSESATLTGGQSFTDSPVPYLPESTKVFENEMNTEAPIYSPDIYKTEKQDDTTTETGDNVKTDSSTMATKEIETESTKIHDTEPQVTKSPDKNVSEVATTPNPEVMFTDQQKTQHTEFPEAFKPTEIEESTNKIADTIATVSSFDTEEQEINKSPIDIQNDEFTTKIPGFDLEPQEITKSPQDSEHEGATIKIIEEIGSTTSKTYDSDLHEATESPEITVSVEVTTQIADGADTSESHDIDREGITKAPEDYQSNEKTTPNSIDEITTKPIVLIVEETSKTPIEDESDEINTHSLEKLTTDSSKSYDAEEKEVTKSPDSSLNEKTTISIDDIRTETSRQSDTEETTQSSFKPVNEEIATKIAEQVVTEKWEPHTEILEVTTPSLEGTESEEATKKSTITEPSTTVGNEEQKSTKSPDTIEVTTIKEIDETESESPKHHDLSHETTVPQQETEKDLTSNKNNEEAGTESPQPVDYKPLSTTKSPDDFENEESTAKVTKENDAEPPKSQEVTQSSESESMPTPDTITSISIEDKNKEPSESYPLEINTTSQADIVFELTTQSNLVPDSKSTEPERTINEITTELQEQSQTTDSPTQSATEQRDHETTTSSLSPIHKDENVTSISDQNMLTETPLNLVTKPESYSEVTTSHKILGDETTAVEIDLSSVTDIPKEQETKMPDEDKKTIEAIVELEEITKKPTPTSTSDEKLQEDAKTEVPVLYETEKDTISEVTTSKPINETYDIDTKTKLPETTMSPKEELAETLDISTEKPYNAETTESITEEPKTKIPIDSEIEQENQTDEPTAPSEIDTTGKDTFETETLSITELITLMPVDEEKLTERPIETIKETETTQNPDFSAKSTEPEKEIYTKTPLQGPSEAADTETPYKPGPSVDEELTSPAIQIYDSTAELTKIPTESSITSEKPAVTSTYKESSEPAVTEQSEVVSSTSSSGVGDRETETILEISTLPESSTKDQTLTEIYQFSTESPKETYTAASEEKITTKGPVMVGTENIYESFTESEEKIKDTEIKITTGQDNLEPTATESTEQITKAQEQGDNENVEVATGHTSSDETSTIPSGLNITATTEAIITSTNPSDIITSQPVEDIEKSSDHEHPSTSKQELTETTTFVNIDDENISPIVKESTETPITTSDQQIVEIVTERQPSLIDTATTKQETAPESMEDEFTTSKTSRPEMYPTTLSAAEESEKPTSSPVIVEVSTAPDQTMMTSIKPHIPEGESSAFTIVSEMDKASTLIPEFEEHTEKVITSTIIPEPSPETLAPEEEKLTTPKAEEISSASPVFDKFTEPTQKPTETQATEQSRPITTEEQPIEDLLTPDEEPSIPPSGTSGYGTDPDYMEEDQTFGPGTCRYGGKVYVSAQQIPRDDPCDFCFCFRSDIICLQQSCPPPIHGCHEEPISGFCCPRYECPVSMATTVNVTTTTTTTTTTLPPHFPVHSYKGSAQKRGCLIKGHTYKVGEVVRASSGPCLHCTCGGDGQMKCDPKQCTPEPMLRQMIAAAVSAKRRR